MTRKYLSMIALFLFLNSSIVFAENPAWLHNAHSITEKTYEKMASILWPDDGRALEQSVHSSISYQKLKNEFDNAQNLNEVNIIVERYILNINPKIPLTLELANEYCRMLNLKLLVYCAFSDLLNFAIMKNDLEDLEEGLEYYDFATDTDWLTTNNKIPRRLISDNSVELLFGTWLSEANKKQGVIIQRANKDDTDRSFVSIFADGTYSEEVAKKAINAFYSIIQDEIPYEWKMTLIKWSKLIKSWETSLKQFEKIIHYSKNNPKSNLKGLADLESFILNANQWILSKDIMTRHDLFDLPLLLYVNLAYFRCQYANAGLFDKNDYLITAGVSFAKTSSFITYIVDEGTRGFISRTKQCLKGSLSNSEYNQLIGWSKVTPHWFEKPRGLNL